MGDQHWPARTPRDEMLERVAARGSRIRAVRGAVNALAILSVVGASALGVGAAMSTLGGSGTGDGTELETVAMEPEQPSSTASDRPGTTGTPITGDGTTTTDVAASSGSPTTRSGATGTSAAPSRPGTTRPAPSGSAPTEPAPTPGEALPPTTEPTTTTSGPEAPEVGNLRMKADGVPLDLSVCLDEPNSVITAEIVGAETATVSWNRGGQTRTVEMTAGDSEWSAPLDEIDNLPGDLPVLVTIEATGPGGTTRTSAEVIVADCTPLPSDPSVPGS